VDAALCLVWSWKKPASAGYRPFPSIASKKKKPLNPCGVVRGVITKLPFSLLLSAEAAILTSARSGSGGGVPES
jgi:hypothetical protein